MKIKALLFNGAALEKGAESTSGIISSHLSKKLEEQGVSCDIFNISEQDIPLLDASITTPPQSVKEMCERFTKADIHFWMAPLYHGSIPGIMKNCLDWLEITSTNPSPYLTDKTVGLICWAEGTRAIQGINTMDIIGRALRAWTIPFSVPIVRNELYNKKDPTQIDQEYQSKLDQLVNIALTKRITSL